MHKILLFASIIIPVAFLNAQVPTAKQPVKRKTCYTAIYLQNLEKQNPLMEKTADFEKWMGAKIKQKRETPVLSNVVNYTPLPVIFHVIHTGQAEGTGYNISQALIRSQVMQLNKDYANLSGSPYAVSSTTGLQFCLAANNPNGAQLSQPGIDRVNATGKTYGLPPYTVGDFETKVKLATVWDPTKYINIWVTEFEADLGILGYSSFPALSILDGLNNLETNNTAGVAVDYQTVGSIANPSAVCDDANTYNTGKTLSHELGHFFGLRHIWGDGECATDYCDDTPPHTGPNFGSPVHPKPNSCPTPDEMFENYMDYSNDKLLNTFTLNQVERMQIVMVNSLRRKELPASTAGCAANTNTSKIGFTPCNGKLSVTEKSTKATCPLYTDVSLYLNIEDKATGAATLQVTTAGTATAGQDYELLTPSLSIAAGESFKLIKVRVFDDAAKEADKTIVLSYAITGNGVTANPNLPQTFTLTILDDDALSIGQNTKVLLSENFGTTGSSFPSGWTTLLYNAYPTPKNRWVVGANPGADFTGQALYISRSFATKKLEYDTTTASAHIARSPAINPGFATNINISFKYKVAGETDDDGTYDFGLAQTSLVSDQFNFTTIPGTGDLVGVYNSATKTVSTVTKTVNTTLPVNLKGKPFYLNFNWENDDNTGTQPPLIIDDILITAKGTAVESQLNHSKSIKVLDADSNFIVSKEDNEIIAAISNSSASIDCIDASIQQAGNGQVDITTSTGTYKRSEKVIKLTPRAASNATSSITLFFTTAELANWASISDLKVMKVQDGVALNSVLTQANAVLLTPVVNDYRQSDGYASFTVTSTGFSQFFLVATNTTLPLQLITFNAVPLNNGASLNWSTGNEFRNKGFNVERSVDGVNFTVIGFVAGKNQTATGGNYSYGYFDNNIEQGITYFYRLQQVDINGKATFSAVRSIKLNGNGRSLVVYPNPTKHFAHVVTGKTMVAAINLTTANGQLVWRMNKQTITSAGFDVPMQQLPRGVYMLWIVEDKNRQNIKIIKE
ncbi:hypothetical protein BH10BAC3_BH10BAC3_03730 [soil metagenome]